MENLNYSKIDRVKNDIIDHALVIGAIVSLITYCVSLIQGLKTGFEYSFLSEFAVVLAVIGVAMFRKRLGLKTKAYIILICIFVAVLGDIIEVGIISANKVLIILIPFFSLISLSIRKSVILLAITIVVFSAIAWLHLDGMLVAKDVTNRLGPTAWLINLLLITLVTIVIVIIVNRFNETYEGLIDDLSEKNRSLHASRRQIASYRDDLEEIIEMRTEELNKANNQLKHQANELRSTVNKLNEAKEELVQTEKMAALGSLSAGVAHELNNPLNFIQGGVEVLEIFMVDNLTRKQQTELKKILESIKEGVKRSARIVKSLNHYEDENEQVEACDVAEVITNSLTILKTRMGNRIRVETDFQKQLIVKAERGSLYQLFLNIISNSIDAIYHEGKISVVVKEAASSNLTEIMIHDTGIGISNKNLKKISDPFFTTKKVGQGIGLGLYICFNIVKKLDGTIHFDSEEGKGTTVSIRLPGLSS
ncbi:MAG: hypothetical protein Tsb0034_00600 [Ekhidna sp.]